MYRCGFLPLAILFALLADKAVSGSSYFEPSARLSGIGVDREGLSELLLAARAEAMVESQTFSIMRDARAMDGARRITAPGLQAIFRKASERSGLPASLIEAMAFLESWGDPRAESPTGPRGIMQIALGTARNMGLRVSYATRYRVTSRRVAVRSKGRVRYRTVRKRTPYTVLVRDDRLNPDLAIPAAASYLARLEERFGGRDWAVFAYHCGEGCASQMIGLTRQARGATEPPTVAQMFFLGSPSHNRELYEAVRRHMQRDYSPTYWFRVMRAQQLLQIWRDDPNGFRAKAGYYRSETHDGPRAPHRLAVWLKSDDIVYQSIDDIASDRRLVQAPDNPDYLGYRLRLKGPNAIGALDPGRLESYLRASPAALGALTYIAYETRRLHGSLAGRTFEPIEVVSLVKPMEYRDRLGGGAEQTEFLSHCTGEVFDIDVSGLPRDQREALEFVLDDLGWSGYLGFVEEAPGSGRIHIGPSPSGREFFTRIYREASGAEGSGTQLGLGTLDRGAHVSDAAGGSGALPSGHRGDAIRTGGPSEPQLQ